MIEIIIDKISDNHQYSVWYKDDYLIATKKITDTIVAELVVIGDIRFIINNEYETYKNVSDLLEHDYQYDNDLKDIEFYENCWYEIIIKQYIDNDFIILLEQPLDFDTYDDCLEYLRNLTEINEFAIYL